MKLELSGVTVRRGGRPLLLEVSLEAAPGQVTAWVGPNGAGKSTLLKVASGEVAPDRGGVSLGGRALGRWGREEVARSRAVVPQHAALSFPFTVEEVVALGRLPWRTPAAVDRAAAQEALRRVGLEGRRGQRYTTLSGGERQRVHLARALAQLAGASSPLLLLDEPTASLDPAHALLVLEVARGVAAEGGAVVVILHELSLAASHADAVAVLHRGRCVAQGPPAEVLEPGLLASVFGLRASVVAHPGLRGPLIVPMGRVEAASEGR